MTRRKASSGPHSPSSRRNKAEKGRRRNHPSRAVKRARPKDLQSASKSSRQILSLQHELASTKAYLQSVIEDQENKSEELRALNEELQNSMDELSTNNEELQSANEEHNALNEELASRNQELDSTNNDIINLFNSLTLKVVILDLDLRIRRLTPAAEKVLNLSPADIGRPFSAGRTSLEIPNLCEMIKEVMQSVSMKQMEIQGNEGQWFSLQVHPYVTADSKIEGAVVALLDVSALRRLTEELARSNHRLQEELLLRRQAEDKFRTLFESAPKAMVIADGSERIVLANTRMEELFGYRRDELIGKLVDILVPTKPTARPSGVDNFPTARRKDGSEFPAEIRQSPIQTKEELLVARTITDVSERLSAAQQVQHSAVLEERNRVARDVHDVLAQGLIAILVQLEAAEGAVGKRPQEVLERLSYASRMARASLEEARRSVAALRSEVMKDSNLVASLLHFVHTARIGRNEKIEFSYEGTPRRLSTEIEENLLRMAQESVNNAMKHANASAIQIKLIFASTEVQLHVVDNGKGFSPGALSGGGFGITSLRERAKKIAAKLEIESAPGKGTNIRACTAAG